MLKRRTRPPALALLLVATALVATPAAALGAGGWAREAAVPPGRWLPFTFALRHPANGSAQLEEAFWAVSDPASPRYGRFLAVPELRDLVAPPPDAVAELVALLRAAGARRVEEAATGDILRCRLRAADAEQLFGVPLRWFANAHGVRVPRGDAAGQPGADAQARCLAAAHTPLPHVVQFVPEVCHFPPRHATQYRQPEDLPAGDEPAAGPAWPPAHFTFEALSASLHGLAGATSWPPGAVASGTPAGAKPRFPPYEWPFHPDQLQVLYNVTPGVLGTGLQSSGQAVCTTGSYDAADLEIFLQRYSPDAAGFGVMRSYNFTNDPSRAASEPSVDVQYVMGMGPKVYTVLWGLRGDFVDGTMWLNIALDYFNLPDPPKVFTVSYTTGEEHLLPTRETADRMNAEFQKMGAAGGSLIFASADYGVGCNPQGEARFTPIFPGSSPYVTSVGGARTAHDGSATVYRGTSGGFSELFPRPSYQDELVPRYLREAPVTAGEAVFPPAELFAAGGRGYPDVAIEGQNMGFILRGEQRTVSGTSAAAPAFAGLVSLLNAARARSGLPPLGFLNPLLYAIKQRTPAAFTDITTGQSKYPCGEPAWDCPCRGWSEKGFPAHAGWNPVTGLGTPNFGVLLEEVLAVADD